MSNNQQLETELILDAARNDLYSYAMLQHPKFIPNEFAEAVAFEIQEVMEGRNDRLILVAPPRMGKSLMTSEIAPAWFLGKFPRKKIIAASHTATLAVDFGGKVRDYISTPTHEQIFGRPGSLNRSKAAAENFRTQAGGEYFAVGVGGTPIGKGADVFVIDDPIRNRADVESPKQREDMKAWYSSSVLSRLEGQGGIILMHQRWHQDDLAGYLLREYADDGWRVVHMPALIETQEDKDVDYLGRDFGESLVPQLHSTEKLLRLKKTMLHRDWMSMYQGQPHDSEGEEFTKDMILRYEQESIVVRQSMNVYIVVDPADSKNKYSDYTAMAVIGLGSDGNYYILDLVREKLDLNERTKTLLDLHRKWRPLSVSYESYGATADIQHIQYVQNEQNYRFPINKLGNAPGQKLNKIERIRRVIPDMLNGRWYAPDHLVKIGMDGQKYEPIELLIEEEMLPFPNSSKHDDAIDAISRVYDLNLIWPSGMNRVTNGVSNQKDKGKVSPW